MKSDATTVKDYLKSLPEDRRAAVTRVREVVRKHLPKGYEERMNWGMITYEVPLSVYPETYNGQPLAYAAIASQKNHMAVYLMCIYAVPGKRAWFEKSYLAAGKKLDMGASCVRFRKLEDLPLELIGEAIAAVPLDEYVAIAKQQQLDRRKIKKA